MNRLNFYDYFVRKPIIQRPKHSVEVMYGSNKFYDNQNGKRNKYWGINAIKE